MKPYYERSGLTLHLGDCLEVMATLPEHSIDTCITDPPYELGFMGKKWDASGIAFRSELWSEVLHVLKPGAMLLAFDGTRTHHRLMCAIEDAGFEIRDCMMWLYGSGFPKSLDISKAIDKAAGAERKSIGVGRYAEKRNGSHAGLLDRSSTFTNDIPRVAAPATDAARTWDGYGTALKPAWEPIIVAMKPLDGTFAENAQKWGVAGLAIDAGRIEGPKGDGVWGTSNATIDTERKFNASPTMHEYRSQQHPKGRWPANLLLDEEAAAMLDEQSGVSKSTDRVRKNRNPTGNGQTHGYMKPVDSFGFEDSGGASRFFYVAKASRSERDAGLENMPKRDISFMNTHNGDADKGETWSPVDERTGKERDRFAAKVRNHHPTVKPVALMEYLCTLTRIPTGGIVLDPFMGSGTTGIGAIKTGRPFVGIERDAQYIEIAYNRLNGIQSGMLL